MYIHLYNLEDYMEKSDIYDLISNEKCEVIDDIIKVEFEQLDSYILQKDLYELAKDEDKEDDYFEYLYDKLDVDNSDIKDIINDKTPIEFIQYIFENSDNNKLLTESILYLLSNNKLNIDTLDDEYINKIIKNTVDDIFIYDISKYNGGPYSSSALENYKSYEPTAIHVADTNIVKSKYSEYKDIIIKIFLKKFSNFCNCELKHEVERHLESKYPDLGLNDYYEEGLIDENDFDWYSIKSCFGDWDLVFCDKNEAISYRYYWY